jgi:hypothetical protein
MTKSMHASLDAIGRQLHVAYLPMSAEPLPTEFKGLVAQLVALKFCKRKSGRRSVDILQCTVVRLAPGS